MKILFAAFSSPQEFLQRLHADVRRDDAVLSVHTRARYDAGEALILEIGFPGLPNRLLLRALALDETGAQARGVASGAGEPCFLIGPEETHKRDFLIAVASGKAVATWQRRHRRFPMRMQVRYAVSECDADMARAELADVGAGGVALRTRGPLPDGARVTVLLEPEDGSASLEFSGRVVWTSSNEGGSGAGIQFESLGGEQMRRLRWMIRDVKLRGETRERPPTA
jgi:Tfp pilus assembly protein PilZ